MFHSYIGYCVFFSLANGRNACYSIYVLRFLVILHYFVTINRLNNCSKSLSHQFDKSFFFLRVTDTHTALHLIRTHLDDQYSSLSTADETHKTTNFFFPTQLVHQVFFQCMKTNETQIFPHKSFSRQFR